MCPLAGELGLSLLVLGGSRILSSDLIVLARGQASAHSPHVALQVVYRVCPVRRGGELPEFLGGQAFLAQPQSPKPRLLEGTKGYCLAPTYRRPGRSSVEGGHVCVIVPVASTRGDALEAVDLL